MVQRVPVKIVLDPGQIAEHPLFIGLSCVVNVDVSDDSGPVLATRPTPGPVFSTNTLAHDMAGINREIAAIINTNSGENGKSAFAEDSTANSRPVTGKTGS